MLCGLSNGLFPQAVCSGVCSSCWALGQRDEQGSWRLAGDRPLGLCSCHSSLGHLGFQGWVKHSMPRGVFPSPSHRCCVYNVQRLHQENSTGCWREVGFLQPGAVRPSRSDACHAPNKAVLWKIGQSLLHSGEIRARDWYWLVGDLEQRAGNQFGAREALRGQIVKCSRPQIPETQQFPSQLKSHPEKPGRGQDASGEWGQ